MPFWHTPSAAWWRLELHVKILFDQGTPLPLRDCLVEHEVRTAHEEGWSRLKNGELLGAAEVARFEAIITTDQNLRYQQNLDQRRIAIVVLLTTSWPRIRKLSDTVRHAVDRLKPNDYIELAFPKF